VETAATALVQLFPSEKMVRAVNKMFLVVTFKEADAL